MQTRSQHLLAEFRGCSLTKLNNLEFIEASMRAAAAEARATVVNSSFHKFGPQGISGVLVLAESHLSVHTWPEHGYAATDIYVCGDSCLPILAQQSLARALEARHTELMIIQRGLDAPAGHGMRVLSHQPTLSANFVESCADASPGAYRARTWPE